MDKIELFLFAPVDGAGIAVFRLLFGLAYFCFALIRYQGNVRFYQSEGYFCSWDLTPFVKPFKNKRLTSLLLQLDVFAVFLFFLGLFTQLSAVFLCLTKTTKFLWDKTQYNNHDYLICLIFFLFSITGGGAEFLALDNIIFSTEFDPAIVPKWHLLILQYQLFVVFFWGGINKINHDWLIRAQPLKSYFKAIKITPVRKRRQFEVYLPSANGAKWLKAFLSKHLTAVAASWFAMVFDLVAIPLLYCDATRLYVIPFFLFFHLFNHWYWTIGIFPYLNYAALFLFIDPATTRFLVDWLSGGYFA